MNFLMGYGINTSLLPAPNEEQLKVLIRMSPYLSSEYNDYVEDHDFFDIIKDFLPTVIDDFNGYASLIAEVIRDTEYINVETHVDDDGNVYILLKPSLPWEFDNLSQRERHLTKKEFDVILRKYLAVFTDKFIVPKCFLVEC